MIKIACDPLYSHPLPDGHRFPMIKYELIPQQLLHEGIISEENLFIPGVLSEPDILQVHQPEYWRQLRDQTLPWKAQRRIGLPFSAQLVERETKIAQGTIEGALHALSTGIAFNVAGGTHHAGWDWGEGFCLLNDQAIAAKYLLERRLAEKVLIIDLDVHQGNGTADIFKNERGVFTFSMHGEKNFPFRKEVSDLDIALPAGTGDEAFLSELNNALSRFTATPPDFVFYLSGVDVLQSDELGTLSISPEGCRTRDEMVFKFCRQLDVPVQVSMGGGYSSRIKDIVDAHCQTFKSGFEIFE